MWSRGNNERDKRREIREQERIVGERKTKRIEERKVG